MTTEVRIAKSKYHSEAGMPHVFQHDTDHLNTKARIAIEMLQRWGMVAAEPDGEDSAGRAKLMLQPVNELVLRAVETVDVAFAAFEEKDWIIKLPSLNELQKMKDEDHEVIS